MKRSTFKPRVLQRDPDRVRAVPSVVPGAFRAPQPVGAPVAPIEKENPVRSPQYLRKLSTGSPPELTPETQKLLAKVRGKEFYPRAH